ncbi:hypothetical protein [Herbidospora mongoliensis]|uniref:hypothetical protein n=1 Tax=Herbidospora mongoliensis TaxID=688067 RepID=UPI00083041BC|nr:hypothetical protein [Herbidospora mongoliensis]
MALYERYDADGVKVGRAFTVPGSADDIEHLAKAQAGIEGWRVADEHAVEQTGELYDPSGDTVPGVLAYLEEADADEVTRVGLAEAEGRNRAGVIDQIDKILASKQEA